MTFGERLFELRTERGISQEQFAELMNVSRQSISKWETDKAYPEMSRLIFMSDYFNVTLDYLIRGKEYATKPDSEKCTKYHTNKLWNIWTSFYTNLSKTQGVMFYLISILLVIALVGLIWAFCYLAGYAIGTFIGHLTP